MSGTLPLKVLVGFFAFYLMIIGLVFTFGKVFSTNNHRELPSNDIETYQPESYRFVNPGLAYEIMSQLEVFDETIHDAGYKPEMIKAAPYMNLKSDDYYCDKRRAYFALHPEVVFEDMPYLSDLAPTALPRKKMLSQLGSDIQPHIGAHMPKTVQLFEIDPAVTLFWSRTTFNPHKRNGKHFSCLSQTSNQIIGKVLITKKANLSEVATEYSRKFQDKPQCHNFDNFIPKTYSLYQKDSCQDFFQEFNSPKYLALKEQQRIVYLKKVGKGVHMGEGVDFVTEKVEDELRTVYGNGTKCGQIEDLSIVQKYIPNPLLLNGRKFDFRSYMLIASTNPLIAYYHDATLRVSLMQYDVNSNDKKTLLTNIALNRGIYEDAKLGNLFQGKGLEDLKWEQEWTFARFEEYLLETGKVKDPAWFNNNLRPQFKKAMIHLLRFGVVDLYQTSSVFALYGLDFMLDNDLNLWFIEANSAPGMDGFSEPIEKFVLKMLKDEAEIAMGLLRSRMKRVINFVNQLIEEGSVQRTEDGEVKIRNLEMNRMMFNMITKNYFEDEFLPSPDNGFSKIIDGNLKGAQKYMGLVSEECA